MIMRFPGCWHFSLREEIIITIFPPQESLVLQPTISGAGNNLSLPFSDVFEIPLFASALSSPG